MARGGFGALPPHTQIQHYSALCASPPHLHDLLLRLAVNTIRLVFSLKFTFCEDITSLLTNLAATARPLSIIRRKLNIDLRKVMKINLPIRVRVKITP